MNFFWFDLCISFRFVFSDLNKFFGGGSVIIRDKTIPHAGSWFTGVVTKDEEAEKEEERKEGVKKDDNKDHAEEKERALKMEVEEKKKKKQFDRASVW